MNSIERHRIAMAMKKPDRVPVAPSFLTRAISLANICQYDYHTNPEVLASAQINHCERYDFDGLFISSDNVIMYEALGGKIRYPDKNSYPFWTSPLLTNERDLKSLKVPNPEKDGRMPLIIEAARIAMERVGDQRFVLANIDSGPFQLALTLMGIEQGMSYLIENPEGMKKILDFCSQVTISYGLGMSKSGVHGLQFGESSAPLIGRKRYESIVWKYDCMVIEELKKLGLYVFFHVCGDSSQIFDLLVDSGAHCLEFDSQMDIVQAKQKAKGKVALKGNINTGYFLSMSVDEISQECKRIIDSAKMDGGFILCGGCEVPANTKDEILIAVRKSVDEFGNY